MAQDTGIQTDFSGGQWSKFAQGRYHDQKYKTALAVCQNYIPLETQNLVRRPGTAWAWPTIGGAAGRVFKFDFEDQTAAYTIELTAGNMCFRQGTSLVDTNDSVSVTSISTANPAVMKVATAVTWVTGNRGYFSGMTGNPYLENRMFTLTQVSDTEFSLADNITAASLDGTLLSSIPATAVFNRVLDISTPYISTSYLADIQIVQSDIIGQPVAFLLHPNFAPYGLTVDSEPTSSDYATFSLNQATFLDGPYLDPPTNGAVLSASEKSGSINVTVSFPAWSSTQGYAAGSLVTYDSNNYVSLINSNVGNNPASDASAWEEVNGDGFINNGSGFLQTDAERLIRLFSQPAAWSSNSSYNEGQIVSYNPSGLPSEVTYWSSLTGSNSGNVPGTDATNWQLLEQGGDNSPALWTWGVITGLVNFIPGNVSGVAQIGNMTGNGGLSAAFNGVVNQNAASSAEIGAGNPDLLTIGVTGYVGQNYSGTSDGAYAISSATIFGSTDGGLCSFSVEFPGNQEVKFAATAYLFGSNIAPGSWNDGTQLGVNDFLINGDIVVPGTINTTEPLGSSVTISSNNTSTKWAYVWVAIVFNITSTQQEWTNGGVDIYIGQVEFVNAQGAGSTASGVSVEILGPALLNTNPITIWQLGVYSKTTGWPTVGTWTDGRLWLGGVVANRIDGCVSNGITVDPITKTVQVNFAPTDQYDNVLDSSGISVVMNLPEANPVLWMMPDQQGIICGTAAREALVYAPSSGGLTPTNIDARKLTRIGSADIVPVQTEHTFVFVQRFLRKIVEYFADIFSGKFTAPNLIQNAKNLTIGGLQELTYQQELAPIIWARVDNSLIGCTYKRDTLMTSTGPTFNGWHTHPLGSERDVESIATGSSENGDLDALTMVTNDSSVNLRFVEVLTDILDEGSTPAEAQYLDAQITPTSTSSVAVSANFPLGGLQLNGLWYLNGKTVTAWLGGLDCGDYTVTNGYIQVPYGDGIAGGLGSFPSWCVNRTDQGLFTESFVSTGVTANGETMFTGTMSALVGFTFTSKGQMVRQFTPQETGARNGPAFAKYGRNHYLMVEFEGAMNVQLGTLFGDLEYAHFCEKDDATPLTRDMQFTGVFRDQFESDYSFDCQPCWQVERPYICNVQIVGYARDTADV